MIKCNIYSIKVEWRFDSRVCSELWEKGGKSLGPNDL